MKRVFDRAVHLLAGAAIILVSMALLDFLLHPLARDCIFHSSIFRAVVMLVFTPLTILVGFLIIRRVPGNIVGPLLIVWSGTVAFWSLRVDINPLLFSLLFFLDFFGWVSLFTMLLHFPDGKIYPLGAASWISRLLGILVIFLCLLFLSIETFGSSYPEANPFFLPALQPFSKIFSNSGLLFFTPILVLALISPILRYKKGNFRERQQIKWLALFGGFIVLYVIVLLVAYPLITGSETMNPGNDTLAVFFYITTGLFPPFAIGVAILRHRLWDIDIIIRRTLVYSILTVILSVVYFGSVISLQGLAQIVTGENQPPIATVLSTLTIAALFTPVRKYIQTFIDRRFYRQKYDAERVLAGFGTILREQVVTDQLASSILKVVEDTMQPVHVSLLLREVNVRPREQQFEENSSPQLSS